MGLQVFDMQVWDCKYFLLILPVYRQSNTVSTIRWDYLLCKHTNTVAIFHLIAIFLNFIFYFIQAIANACDFEMTLIF